MGNTRGQRQLRPEFIYKTTRPTNIDLQNEKVKRKKEYVQIRKYDKDAK